MVSALPLGLAVSGAVVACGTDSGNSASRAGQPEETTVGGAEESYDLRRSGAACDGQTDDTASWAHAVSTVAGRGGGLIRWTGTSVARQIKLDDKVGLIGAGPAISVIKHSAKRADGEHLLLLEVPDAKYVSLRNFGIDGNRKAQTGLAAAIHFDNTAGKVNGAARHLIRDVHIRNVAGTGIFWGYRMRSSVVDNVNIYYCDEYGFHGNVFSDNTIQNLDVGQSGLAGVYLVNCFNSKFSNIKSWYSGRLQAGSPGIYQRNGAINVYSNILAQENSGSGMMMYGADTAISGVIVRGFNSDSDNAQAAETNFGISLNNVANSMFDLTVSSKAPRQTKTFAGVALTNSSGNKLVANIDPLAVTWELAGQSIGENDIDLCRGTAASAPVDDNVAVNVYTDRENRVTLNGNKAIGDPSTPSDHPPIGLRYGFVFIQDSAGGHALSWPSAYKIPSSTVFNTDAGSRTFIEFECSGNKDWIMVSFATGIPG